MARISLAQVDPAGAFGRNRGTGTALPTTDLRRGDAYFHTGLSCLMVYTGAAWRQATVPTVADVTALRALPTADLHDGFRVTITNANTSDAVRAGGKWRLRRFGVLGATTDANGTIYMPHGLGDTPTIALLATMWGTNDTISAIAKPQVYSVDATNVTVVVWRTDTNAKFASNPIAFHWSVEV